MPKRIDLNKIKTLRKDNLLTLEDMAKKLGYGSPQGYYYLEIGRGQFTAVKLAEVADIFGVSMEGLIVEDV